jgi:Spy/CpxP family protein refolding chaperone
MKTHAKLLPVLALALLAVAPALRAEDASAAPAQATRMQQMREKRLQQLDQTLHLTADQKAKIEAIWDKAVAQGRDSVQDEKATRRTLRAERRERRQALREAHQQIRSVLTPEQQKLFDQMPRPGRGDHHPAAAPADGQT